MYEISKEFAFSASHIVEGLREGHQCGRLHGHNYVIKAILRAETLDEVGFIVDYGDLAPFKDWIDRNLDHRHLNDKFGENPTAENMAKALASVLRGSVSLPEGVKVAIAVSETPKTWATWTE